MSPELSKPDTMSSKSSQNLFAEAIFSFIEEMKNDKDRKSIFYKEVIEVACRMHMTDDPTAQSLVSAGQLSNFITELETQHKKKNGIRRAFASAQPLVEGLMQYTSAVDVMIQADPTVSALVYGGAKLILQLANGYNKYFESITQMMADVGVQLQYFHIYTQEFAGENYMSNILCNSYRDILYFWKDASKILNQRGKRFLASGLLIPFHERYAKFKQKLDNNAQNVRHMAQALHVKAQGSFNRNHEMQVQDLALTLTRTTSPRPPSYEKDPGNQHDEIRKWISGGRISRIDPQCDLDRHLSSKHNGTSEWIFEDPNYVEWQSSGDNSFLWINAAPGSGKSVLSASIVDKLMHSVKKEQANVIYFFCRFDDPEKCKAISTLRSLAVQALKLIKYIPDELCELYQDEYTTTDCFVANIAVAEQALGYLLKRIEHVSIVIDGLDECHDGALVDSLIRLRNQKTYGITKWLFTSRNDPVVRKMFEAARATILNVPSTVIQDDIRKFLVDNSDVLCGTSDQLDRIAKLSQGNFLMMRLTVDPFRNEELTCSEEFEEALNDFQPELGRCWYRSLQRLSQRSEQIQDLAQMIFTAIILAAQPMTFNELLELLSIKIGEEPSVRRRRTRSVILSACSPFVEIDKDTDLVNPTLRLVHKSVGDLLTQDPESLAYVSPECHRFFVKMRDGSLEIRKRCMAYLSYSRYSNFNVNATDDNSPEHGLLKYASIFWHKHLQDADGDHELFDEIRDFMKSPNFWTCLRVQSQFAPHMFAKLLHNSKTDGYSMQYPGQKNNDTSGAEEYYANALPGWIGDYDNHGDHLVWGYHMFVREWSDLLVKRPEAIEKYFAKILGPRSFWESNNTEACVKVETVAASDTIESQGEYMIHRSELDADDIRSETTSPENIPYIREILQNNRGVWSICHCNLVYQGGIAAKVYRFKQTAKSIEGSDEDSEEEDSDDEKEVPKTTHEPAIWFLSITRNEEQSHWFHHITTKGIMQVSKPIIIAGMKLLLWPQSPTSIVLIDTESFQSSVVNIPITQFIDQKKNDELLLILQEYNFSPNTGILHCASIYGSTGNDLTLRHTQLKISVTPDSKFPTISPVLSSVQETAWKYPTADLKLPAAFFWEGNTLYAALGKTSIKILRFPPTSANTSSSKPIQVLKRHLHIPASSYSRNPRFQILPDTDPTSQRSRRAIFTLAASPKLELPAISLNFKLESSDWTVYDSNAVDEDSVTGDSSSFLKGAYASKEQAFCVPIRSGQDWRRSVYVTCW